MRSSASCQKLSLLSSTFSISGGETKSLHESIEQCDRNFYAFGAGGDIEKLGGDHKTRRTAAIASLKVG
jgi:hypothetical protein